MKDHFTENRFNYFLYSLVGLMVISPLFPPLGTHGVFPFISLCFTAASVFILRTLIRSNRTFYLTAGIYIVIFLVNAVFIYVSPERAPLLNTASNAALFIALVIFLRQLLLELFKSGKVTGDSIRGGICIYLLLGFLWGLVFQCVHHLHPDSFIIAEHESPNMFYFSFVTLASLGYGDIVPATRLVQMLAVLEAVTGQVFLAVYIARLMGMHMAHHIKKD